MPGSGMVIQAGSVKHRPAGREKENDEKAEKDAGKNCCGISSLCSTLDS